MKRVLLLLLLVIPFLGLRAQSDVKDEVVAALGSGNASAVAGRMVANVDMTLPGTSDYYSKAQAEQILRKFFDQHPAKGMSIEHEGNSQGGDSYYIGTLHSTSGDFRVTFFLKKVGEGFQVKQLRIETNKADH